MREISHTFFVGVIRVFAPRLGDSVQRGLIALGGQAPDLPGQIGETRIADEVLQAKQSQRRMSDSDLGAVALGEALVLGDVQGFVKRHAQGVAVFEVRRDQVNDAIAVHESRRAGSGRIVPMDDQPAGLLQRLDVALAQGVRQLGASLSGGEGQVSGRIAARWAGSRGAIEPVFQIA
ncbi:MAG TPA: hypothetical protein PLU26_02115 [Candidatus Competibacter sp.]|nr:hypothetical protein [Candidatus Competibacter sp.]